MTITNISDVERELRAEIARLKEWSKLGLAALEYASTGNRRAELIAPAIAAFKQALAKQPAQPYKGIADHIHQATNGRARIDPVTGAFGVGILPEQPAQQQELQTCNCRWEGEVQVQQCTLHEAHVDAIHEWAEQAKSAERQFKNFHRLLCERFGYTHDERDWRRDQLSLIEWIAKRAEQPAQQEPVECQYGKGGYACCEGGPCKADEQNNAPRPAQQRVVKYGEALYEAVSAIYFTDSSDYLPALRSVVRCIAPDIVALLDSNPSAAWHQAEARKYDMINAAPQPAQQQEPDANTVKFTLNHDMTEMLRLDREGFHYNGQVIKDAGEAYRLFNEWLAGVNAPASKPLTDEEINAGRRRWLYSPAGSPTAFKAGVCFAEAAHGIKEQP